MVAAVCWRLRASPDLPRARAAILHATPILGFILVVAWYFKARGVFVAVFADIPSFGRPPMAFYGLGSTLWGTIALTVFWLAHHPLLFLKDPAGESHRGVITTVFISFVLLAFNLVGAFAVLTYVTFVYNI